MGVLDLPACLLSNDIKRQVLVASGIIYNTEIKIIRVINKKEVLMILKFEL